MADADNWTDSDPNNFEHTIEAIELGDLFIPTLDPRAFIEGRDRPAGHDGPGTEHPHLADHLPEEVKRNEDQY